MEVFTIGDGMTTVEQTQPEVKMGNIGMDFTKLTNHAVPIFTDQPAQKQVPSKRKKKEVSTSGIITDTLDDNNSSSRELSILETNEPYNNKYTETDAMLKSAVLQIDTCLSEVHEDIEMIRSAKTLRGKYTYLSNMQGAMGTLIGNKIAAARELNNTITKCNDLELRRYKEVRTANLADEQDDNKRIQEMYQAFVSTPVGSGRFTQTLGPSTADLTIMGSPYTGTMIGDGLDAQFDNYMANLTPAQNTMMLMETNPNIKQVVVYNQETGAQYFDVIDTTTGQSIPNADKHDPIFLEDISINQRDMIATNTNLGESYPLVIVGKPILSEY